MAFFNRRVYQMYTMKINLPILSLFVRSQRTNNLRTADLPCRLEYVQGWVTAILTRYTWAAGTRAGPPRTLTGRPGNIVFWVNKDPLWPAPSAGGWLLDMDPSPDRDDAGPLSKQDDDTGPKQLWKHGGPRNADSSRGHTSRRFLLTRGGWRDSCKATWNPSAS